MVIIIIIIIIIIIYFRFNALWHTDADCMTVSETEFYHTQTVIN
jgi:hypothetical protein